MQTHLLSLNSSPSILENNLLLSKNTSIIGSIQTCVVIRSIGSSLAVRIPSINQYGTVSSTHLSDEKSEDFQQLLSSFQPGEKIQYVIHVFESPEFWAGPIFM
jgi:hypothetical protein